MRPTTEDVLTSVAGHGIPGAMGRWPDEPLDASGWSSLTSRVRAQRLSGLLVESIASGSLPTTPTQAEAAAEAHFHAACDSLRLESGLLGVVETLQAAGVQARVLKGSAVAHLDYPDPAQRLFGDIDLIVRSEQFDDAVAVLSENGNHRRYPQPRAGFDRRFSKGTSFRTADRLEIDLHRTFVMGPYGLRVDLDEVWRTESRFELAGRSLSALDNEVRFVHACFHAALGDVVPRLVPQRDVVQMLLSNRVDVARVRSIAQHWQAEPVVARAVAYAWQTLRIADVTALSSWAHRYVPSDRAQRELAVYTDLNGSYAAKSLAAIRALPSVRDKAAFALCLTFPERAYVTGRHSGPRDRWQRGLRALALRRQRA